MTQNDYKQRPLGVFDSGLGGVSVLGELLRLMPQEDFIYLGDSAYAPYGKRSPQEILERVHWCADKLYNQYEVKALVVACNTATGVAIQSLRSTYSDIPVIGIEPAIKPASLQKKNPHVLVLATPVTLNQVKFRELSARFSAAARIDAIPGEGLVEWIESRNNDYKQLDQILISLLSPFQGDPPDSIVLGCTHYPLIKNEIQRACATLFQDHTICILDGGLGTARQTRKQLADRGWLKENGTGDLQVQNTAGQAQIRATYEMLEHYLGKEQT